MKRTEMEIIRALSVKLSEDVLLTVTYQYHTEKDPADHQGRKNDRARSRYRMLGRVERISDIEAVIQRLHSDAFRLQPWKWPDDPSWDGDILYMKDASNEGYSNWLRLKIRKAVTREQGLALLKGFKKDTDRGSDTFGQYVVFTPNAVYDTKGYSCSDGSTVDLDDFDALLTKVGQNVWKEIQMKLVGPGAKGARPFQADEGKKKEAAGPEIVETT